MLTRRQQIFLKRAQAEAGLADYEYREAIALVSGMTDCRSSTDRRLVDGHWDALLSFFEAIYWRELDAGRLQPSCNPDAIFRERGYWARKNRVGSNSRDRYVERDLSQSVLAAEGRLMELGFGLAYLQAIQNRIRPFSLARYKAALERTLRAKEKKVAQPF